MIKAVLFDVDGVLIDSFDANLKFFQDLLSESGYKPLTSEQYRSDFHMSMWAIIKKYANLGDEKEVEKVWEKGRSNETKYPYHLLKLTEGVEKTIESLSKDYLLAIVTSRVKEGIDNNPVVTGIINYFKVVITFQDTEKHKPDPEPILLAAKKLEIKPEEAIYVGDTQSDISAGTSAGMQVIYFSNDKDEKAISSTHRFEDIPQIVKNIS